MATRPRDGKARKFGNAVWQIAQANGYAFATEKQATQFLRRVTRLKRWKNYEAAGLVYRAPTAVRFTNSEYYCDSTISGWRDDICLGPSCRNAITVLHVLAHHAAPGDKALHGPEFVKIFLDLIARYIGADDKREAKDILIKNGIKTQTVRPETRLKQQQAYLRRRAPQAREKLLAILQELGENISEGLEENA